ncbi:MAG: TIGR03118 family protein, partial [Tepidisphaeraceae bacterium]
ANFTANRIEVFKSDFTSTRVSGTFQDPNLPARYSPFNIQNINNELYVMFAKREPGNSDESSGAGTGVVDVFGTDGKLIRRFAAGGKLNAPWGVALAPSNFGVFSGDILVGNFGDGRVTAFDPVTGAKVGQISDAGNQPIALDGLWGIAFGNGRAGNLTNGLYFAAGPNYELNGLYGRLLADQPIPGGGTPYAFSFAIHDASDDLFDSAGD